MPVLLLRHLESISPKHFLKVFFRQERARDFHWIMKANEDEEDGVTNDHKVKHARQHQPLPPTLPPIDVAIDQ